MRIRIGSYVLALALIAAACTPGTGDTTGGTSTTSTSEVPETSTTPPPTLPPEEDVERAAVTGVIDGDTIQVTVAGSAEDVRLLGINAPEAAECFGSEARSILADLVAGATVVMVAGQEDVDRLGRLLRYLYLDDPADPVFVNAELVATGAAVAVQNGHPKQADFKEAEGRAYASGKGMWETFACGHPEEGSPDRPQLRISGVSVNPDGDDNTPLEAEWIEIVNESYTSVSLGGWIVRDESSDNRFTIPNGTGINPGGVIRLVTGCGTGGAETMYWCSETPVWSNGGDTVIIQDSFGNVVDRMPYDGEVRTGQASG